MKLNETDRNRIRCSVALTVPIVLRYLASSQSERNFEAIRHYLPSYEVTGLCQISDAPYFVPAVLKMTGKKREYINSSGYRIFYLTPKMLKRFKSSINGFYHGSELEFANKLIEFLGNRWIITSNAPSNSNNWESFYKSIVGIETEKSWANHPPTGTGMYSTLTVVKRLGNYICQTNKDQLADVGLSKYNVL